MTPPDTHTTAQQMEITDRLLAVLAQHDAPAIGFVNESKLEVDGEARGHDLHWFRHPYLHTGRSAEVQRRTTRFLEEHGYRAAGRFLGGTGFVGL